MIYLIVIAALLLLIVIGLNNSLVRRKNDLENAFASIDVMLKKRYDLIPNLVETVKSYMKHEKSLQAMSTSRGELIKLEHPEFEKEFCVYGDNQIKARYILSPSLIHRIV